MVTLTVVLTERSSTSTRPHFHFPLNTNAEKFLNLKKDIIDELESRNMDCVLRGVKVHITSIKQHMNNEFIPNDQDLLKNYKMENSHLYAEIDCVCLTLNQMKFIIDKDEYITESVKFLERSLDVGRDYFLNRFLHNERPSGLRKISLSECFNNHNM